MPSLLAAWTPEAFAEDTVNYSKRLAILPIVAEGPHGQASLSAIFGAVTAATAERVELRVISFEEIFVASKEGLVERVRDCGPNVKCTTRRLRRFNARFGVIVVLNFGLDPALMNIQILDTDLGTKVAERIGDLNGKTEVAIVEQLQQEADGLLEEAGFARSGRLLVDVDPSNATVSLTSGDAPDLGSGGVFTLPAGTYDVRASAPGWNDASATAEVQSGETTNLQISLVEQTSVFESPWLWVAAGVVLAGGIVGTAALARDNRTCVCITLAGTGCTVCDNR